MSSSHQWHEETEPSPLFVITSHFRKQKQCKHIVENVLGLTIFCRVLPLTGIYMTSSLYWLRGLCILLYFPKNSFESNAKKILPFFLLPHLTLLHSLCSLDPIQMLFFSTPLWKQPPPIVHKISPMVPADPTPKRKACMYKILREHAFSSLEWI